MKPETLALLKTIADETAILLSGFAGDQGAIAAGLIRISETTAAAYFEHTGEPIDEASIKPVEKLNPEDLLKGKRFVIVDGEGAKIAVSGNTFKETHATEETTASADDSLPAHQVPDGE